MAELHKTAVLEPLVHPVMLAPEQTCRFVLNPLYHCTPRILTLRLLSMILLQLDIDTCAGACRRQQNVEYCSRGTQQAINEEHMLTQHAQLFQHSPQIFN
jgi:hypothetical protein